MTSMNVINFMFSVLIAFFISMCFHQLFQRKKYGVIIVVLFFGKLVFKGVSGQTLSYDIVIKFLIIIVVGKITIFLLPKFFEVDATIDRIFCLKLFLLNVIYIMKFNDFFLDNLLFAYGFIFVLFIVRKRKILIALHDFLLLSISSIVTLLFSIV